MSPSSSRQVKYRFSQSAEMPAGFAEERLLELPADISGAGLARYKQGMQNPNILMSLCLEGE